MTQNKEDAQRIAELNSTFMTLNDRSRDSALIILRALSFAQTVMGTDAYEETEDSAQQRAARADEPSLENRLIRAPAERNWELSF